MRLIFNFTKDFPALREGLEASGCELLANLWEPEEHQLAGVDACLLNFYEGVRQPWRTRRLKTRLKRHGIPHFGIDRDTPWHMGVRNRRLWLFGWLRPLDVYASPPPQLGRVFAPEKLDIDECVARIRHYLAHPDEARAITEAAHRRVMRDHTYKRRAQYLLAAIAAWRERHV